MFNIKILKISFFLFFSCYFTGCSVKQIVINNLLNSSTNGVSSIYLTENDPELVRESLPTNIKLIELLIQQSPNSSGLLISASQVLTVYSYAFILKDAEYVLDEDFKKSRILTQRGKKLLFRARQYAIDAIETKHKDFFSNFSKDYEKYLLDLDKDDLDEIYWLAASWALLISISQDDPKMLAELPKIGLLIDRGIQINENYENGSFYDVKFSYDLARPDISDEIAIQSYEKAIELANGSRASLYLSYAESISLKNQNKTEFLKLINQVLTYDTEKYPNQRLSNILAQERAQWLKSRIDLLFF
tara:strand:+ start:73784 stop:74692 length:909 start_codon:yes stop_codon:yes gene_type:complete